MFNYTSAFSSFSVADLQQAKAFYGNLLGLETKDNPMGLLELHLAGGQNTVVYSKPNHVPATFTVLNFVVDDIEEAVKELSGKGISFEQYTGSIQTDKKGISTNPGGPRIAWFKDPAGNILSVLQNR